MFPAYSLVKGLTFVIQYIKVKLV